MSLYTKYRPKDFDNLVGQDFIKETLKKAIIEDKTVWAYLFCWPRWTGKTSSARIFAKAINCQNLQNGNPCLNCENCKEFAEEKLIDIIEIDAASHTWVDNIREIIEKAQFAPTKTKYKIYIIDEVHMLSKWAFNALLKILEEPPAHVKFILATTENHKVPETIISRCQRYDFRRIDEENLKKRLLFIADSENVKIDEKSLEYIMSSSNWWLRNAISLFEQLIENGEIIFERIVEKMGISSKDELENFLQKLEKKDISIISDFENIISSGKNLKLFFKELIFNTKNKIFEKIKSGEDIWNIVKIFDILDETYTKTKNSLDENTTFTVGILKIIWNISTQNNSGNENIQTVPNIEIFSKKIEILEKKIEDLEKNLKNIWNNNNLNQNNFFKEKEIETQNFSKKEEIIPKSFEEDFSLWSSDLDDIFGEENFSENIPHSNPFPQNEKRNEDSSKSLNSWSFNSDDFSKKIKENWWDSALFWAIKWCKFTLFDWVLEISPTTKIARTNVEKSDNLPIMMKSLSDLGFENYKITII